jgi:hypothetical protein
MRGHHNQAEAFTPSPLNDSRGRISVDQGSLYAQMMKRGVQEVVQLLLCLRLPRSHYFTNCNAVHANLAGALEWWQHVQEVDLRIKVLGQRNRITCRA